MSEDDRLFISHIHNISATRFLTSISFHQSTIKRSQRFGRRRKVVLVEDGILQNSSSNEEESENVD
jgi:hypothetical protein